MSSQTIDEWPQRGGANGSIRFYPEIEHGANAGASSGLSQKQSCSEQYLIPLVHKAGLSLRTSAWCCVQRALDVWHRSPRLLTFVRSCAGLVDALKLLQDIADSHKGVSYADLLQLASATAIEARSATVQAPSVRPLTESRS